MFEALKDLKACHDKERQARREIEQDTKLELARMQQEFEEKQALFEKEFEARNAKYDTLQQELDTALEKGDTEAVKRVFEKLANVYKG